jgi:hypothetical protein
MVRRRMLLRHLGDAEAIPFHRDSSGGQAIAMSKAVSLASFALLLP